MTFEFSCLNASVAWMTPYSQVRCCFRCCLAHWQQQLGLDKMYRQRVAEAEHRTRGSIKWEHIERRVRTLPAWDEVALTRSSPFVWANYLMEHRTVYVKGPFGPKRHGLASVDRRRGFGDLAGA